MLTLAVRSTQDPSVLFVFHQVPNDLFDLVTIFEVEEKGSRMIFSILCHVDDTGGPVEWITALHLLPSREILVRDRETIMG